MRPVAVIRVPYDSGHRDFRMGRGPEHLVDGGVLDRLRSAGHDVGTVGVEGVDADLPVEPAATFGLARQIASSVREAVVEGRRPLVLSGNCGSAVGTVSGLGDPPVGIVWLDAHGDLNTPDTSASGFLDGMMLATLVGRCWQPLARTAPGFRPVPEDHTILVAARVLDTGETDLLDTSPLTLVPADAVRGGGLEAVLDDLANRVSRVYFHLDLDVLDARVAKVNAFAAEGGLTVDEVAGVIEAVGRRFDLAAAAITAYDPEYDEDGAALAAASDLLLALAAAG